MRPPLDAHLAAARAAYVGSGQASIDAENAAAAANEHRRQQLLLCSIRGKVLNLKQSLSHTGHGGKMP